MTNPDARGRPLLRIPALAALAHPVRHNSLFLGWEFTGRVTHTLVGGEVVFGAGAK